MGWRPPRKLPPDSQLVAEYEKGASTVGLALKYGVSQPAISQRLAVAGVRTRPRSEAHRRGVKRTIRSDVPTTEIVSAYENASAGEVALRFQMSRQAVLNRLKAAGISIRPRKRYAAG